MLVKSIMPNVQMDNGFISEHLTLSTIVRIKVSQIYRPVNSEKKLPAQVAPSMQFSDDGPEYCRRNSMKKDILEACGFGLKPHSRTHKILGEMWQEVYQNGGALSFQVVSGSMSPIIEVGNVVKVSRVEPSEIQFGDIVAFQDGQNVVVHRVIGKSGSGRQLSFRQMGDTGSSSGKFPAQGLIGKVTAIQKQGREIQLSSRKYIISNHIFGWRLRLIDSLSQGQYHYVGTGLRLAFRPMWRLYRSLLLQHF